MSSTRFPAVTRLTVHRRRPVARVSGPGGETPGARAPGARTWGWRLRGPGVEISGARVLALSR
eukprot:1894902-Pyramimonas_sp.AAC.1